MVRRQADRIEAISLGAPLIHSVPRRGKKSKIAPVANGVFTQDGEKPARKQRRPSNRHLHVKA
jgi:hypothetical protein